MAIVNGTIQHASYTDAQWTAWNGVLLDGQVGYVTDVFYTGTTSQKFKIGNGVDTWNNLDYHPEGGGGAVTAADNGLGLNGTTVELGINDLNRNTIIEALAFKFLMQSKPDAFKTIALEKSKVGDKHFAGAYAENTETNLKAYTQANGDEITGVIQAEIAVRDDVNQTITGFTFLKDGIGGSTRGDLLLTVNTLVGTLTISETVTAQNGATGVVHSRTATEVRVLPTAGDWLNATSLTGNTSLATANISAVTAQKWAYGDHNDFLWLVYDEYEGYIIVGHDSAERPNVGVLVRNEVYLLDYPETRDDTGVIPQTNVLYTGPNGEVCSAPFSGGGGNTIYTGDDSLTGNRVVTKAGFDLSFNGAGRFEVINATSNSGLEAVLIVAANTANGNGIVLQGTGASASGVRITGDTSGASQGGVRIEGTNNSGDPNASDVIISGKTEIVNQEFNAAYTNIGLDSNGRITTNAGNRIGAVEDVIDTGFSVTDNDYLIKMMGLTAPQTVTLDPSSSLPIGFSIIVKDVDGLAGTHNITIDASGTDTIDGQPNFVIANNLGCLKLVHYGGGKFGVLYYYFP